MERPQIPPELMALVAKGDKNAFEEVYRLTHRQLFSFLLSLTADQERARDIMQETYLKTYVAARQYREKGNPFAWILTIAKNLFLMSERDRNNNVSFIDDTKEEIAGISYDEIEDIEAKEIIQAMFRILSRQERCIVVLHDVSGFKHKEIAGILKIPLGTVLSKYSRAVGKMREKGREMGITENEDDGE